MPKPRRVQTRKPKPRILILCEGEKTEPYYFNDLIKDRQYGSLSSVRVEIPQIKKNTAKELVKAAINYAQEARREKNPFLEIWVAIDKDGYTKHPEAFNQAASNGINIAFSSIAFEFWILLHFTYTTKAFSKCDELIDHIKDNALPGYEKKDKIYNTIKHLTCAAISNAQQLKKSSADLKKNAAPHLINPYTNIDTLVCRLIHFEDLKDDHGRYISIPCTAWNIEISSLVK